MHPHQQGPGRVVPVRGFSRGVIISGYKQTGLHSLLPNGLDEEALFDPKLLQSLDWTNRKSSFRDDVSPAHPGDNLVLRPLEIADYDKGYPDLLSQLTSVGDVCKATFIKRFLAMKSCKDTYYIAVLEDTISGLIIGTATLLREQKFIHSAGTRGRIEDVVVNSDYRGKQLGKLLVEAMTLLGKELGCYKMSLECKDENFKFYQGFGYEPDGQFFMVQRYKD